MSMTEQSIPHEVTRTAEVEAPRLAATNVSVRFAGVQALTEVSLSVPPRCVTGLVGPNGAGKSTMFAVLSGIVRPQQGEVALNGVDVSRMSTHARSRAGLARTFQHPELFSSLSVRDHLVLGYRMSADRSRLWKDLFAFPGRTKASAIENSVVDGLLDILDLKAEANADVRRLPLGICRLVEVGRALAARPSIVLLDEPSAGLSPRETTHLTDALAAVAASRDVSMLLVEHDLEMVLKLSQQIVVLDFGVRIAGGTPDEIRRDPVVRAAYLGNDLPVPTHEETSHE